PPAKRTNITAFLDVTSRFLFIEEVSRSLELKNYDLDANLVRASTQVLKYMKAARVKYLRRNKLLIYFHEGFIGVKLQRGRVTSNEICKIGAVNIKFNAEVTCATKSELDRHDTLSYKVHGKTPFERRMGPESYLSTEQENVLVLWILEMAKAGFPVTVQQLQDSRGLLLLKNTLEMDNLKTFRNSKKWSGDIQDKSLIEFWKNIKNKHDVLLQSVSSNYDQKVVLTDEQEHLIDDNNKDNCTMVLRNIILLLTWFDAGHATCPITEALLLFTLAVLIGRALAETFLTLGIKESIRIRDLNCM
ncbi:hypothetical protein HW555_013128, partial [Spodoptera exigua]